MKFRPLHDRVVVKRVDAEDKTAGGIIIPDSTKEKPSQGEILSIGPGGRDEAGKLIPIDLKKNPEPSEEEVRFWLAGNLCRCTGYDKIVRAVLQAAAEIRET